MNQLHLSLAIVCITILAPLSFADDAEPGKQTAQQLVVTTGTGDDALETTVRFWLFLPETYADQDEWPLMLFLHGAGERGDNLAAVKSWGPPKIVQQKTDFPFVVVSPQCPAGQRWEADPLAHLIDHLSDQYKIDKSRMYVTGLSMGGYGTWLIAAKHPKLFAAAVPICGGGDSDTAQQLTHLPIWAFHGGADTVVPARRSEVMVDAIKKANGDKVKLTIYDGVGHNSWSETYANPDVYKWLLSHRRAQ